jgi:hypothetical protein
MDRPSPLNPGKRSINCPSGSQLKHLVYRLVSAKTRFRKPLVGKRIHLFSDGKLRVSMIPPAGSESEGLEKAGLKSQSEFD